MRHPLLLLAVIIAVGFVLRLHGLGADSLSHPEIYIPGIDLPPHISEPPPRHGLLETLRWHFHDEPHPIGYYLAMGAWTDIFGTSAEALRFPSVIFGVASVYILFRLASTLYGPQAGLLAGLGLAAHGFHVYWSQVARMYVPGCFFGLLATWMLVKIASSDRPRPFAAAVYIGSIAAGTQTMELMWALLGVHMGWVVLTCGDPDFTLRGIWRAGALRVPRLAYYQAVALIISLPALAHSLYQARGDAAPEASVDFLIEYFAFGFLFEPDSFSEPVRSLHPALLLVTFLAGLALTILGAIRRPSDTAPAPAPGIVPVRLWPLALLALAGSVTILWLAFTAARRNVLMAALAVLPVAATFLPPFAAGFRPQLRRLLPSLEKALRPSATAVALVTLLAVIAPLLIFALSFVKSVLASRAFLLFVPYLVILFAAGLMSFQGRPTVLWPATAAVAAIFAAGIVHASWRETSARDYEGLARGLEAQLRPGDIVFLRPRHWADTPLLYYVNSERVVASRYAGFIAAHKPDRVWVVVWTADLWADPYRYSIADDMKAALPDYAPSEVVLARRARAILFERGSSDGLAPDSDNFRS